MFSFTYNPYPFQICFKNYKMLFTIDFSFINSTGPSILPITTQCLVSGQSVFILRYSCVDLSMRVAFGPRKKFRFLAQ